MINKLHGKYYYIEVPNVEIGKRILDIAYKEIIFIARGITFRMRYDDGKFYIIAIKDLKEEVPVGAFRGVLYAAYEKFKRDAYKIIKKESKNERN